MPALRWIWAWEKVVVIWGNRYKQYKTDCKPWETQEPSIDKDSSVLLLPNKPDVHLKALPKSKSNLSERLT